MMFKQQKLKNYTLILHQPNGMFVVKITISMVKTRNIKFRYCTFA